MRKALGWYLLIVLLLVVAGCWVSDGPATHPDTLPTVHPTHQQVAPGTVLAPLPECTTRLDACRIGPCPSDDGPARAGTACYWDADRMGDGRGTSFWVDSHGVTRQEAQR